MTIKDLKGLKYPDEYMIKFFFKAKLFEKKGKVIEFGCANGNNLALFHQYNYDTIGIDYSKSATENAIFNFKNIYKSGGNYVFHSTDMLDFVNNNKSINADVFLIPNVISYISKNDFVEFLKISAKNNIYKKNADFFIRTRTKKDYRYGLGKEITKDSFLMETNITGENNSLCTCYDEYELILILKEHLNLKDFKVFSLDNQNDQGHKILNSDIAIWGKIE
ncbi:MAG: methyltransferase domain-containing protein [Arcobacteraceae bacterium]